MFDSETQIVNVSWSWLVDLVKTALSNTCPGGMAGSAGSDGRRAQGLFLACVLGIPFHCPGSFFPCFAQDNNFLKKMLEVG